MVRSINAPSLATLKKYGITAETWYTILDLQDGKCPICGRAFTDVLRPVIDHEHVKGYKNLPAYKRAKYVRGLLCNYDNRRRVPTNSKGISAVEIAYNVYQYLSDYQMRYDDPT